MPHSTESWEELYGRSEVSRLPWYTEEFDSDLRASLRTFGPPKGRILDIGTGPGTHAVGLSRIGYDVVAIDISRSAVRAARAYARKAGVNIELHVDNFLRSRLPDAYVDAAIDRGFFHVLPPKHRLGYAATVHRILQPHGLLHLKCFSDKEPGEWGPYRISRTELRSSFREHFDVLSIRETVFQGNVEPHPHALIAALRRR